MLFKTNSLQYKKEYRNTTKQYKEFEPSDEIIFIQKNTASNELLLVNVTKKIVLVNYEGNFYKALDRNSFYLSEKETELKILSVEEAEKEIENYTFHIIANLKNRKEYYDNLLILLLTGW